MTSVYVLFLGNQITVKDKKGGGILCYIHPGGNHKLTMSPYPAREGRHKKVKTRTMCLQVGRVDLVVPVFLVHLAYRLDPEMTRLAYSKYFSRVSRF